MVALCWELGISRKTGVGIPFMAARKVLKVLAIGLRDRSPIQVAARWLDERLSKFI